VNSFSTAGEEQSVNMPEVLVECAQRKSMPGVKKTQK
jgi:hypothetical protein